MIKETKRNKELHTVAPVIFELFRSCLSG